MQVVNLAEHQGKKVADLLEMMMILARRGEIRALAFVAKFGQGNHQTGRVGDYRDHPHEALLAVQRLNQKLLAHTDSED